MKEKPIKLFYSLLVRCLPLWLALAGVIVALILAYAQKWIPAEIMAIILQAVPREQMVDLVAWILAALFATIVGVTVPPHLAVKARQAAAGATPDGWPDTETDAAWGTSPTPPESAFVPGKVYPRALPVNRGNPHNGAGPTPESRNR